MGLGRGEGTLTGGALGQEEGTGRGTVRDLDPAPRREVQADHTADLNPASQRRLRRHTGEPPGPEEQAGKRQTALAPPAPSLEGLKSKPAAQDDTGEAHW